MALKLGSRGVYHSDQGDVAAAVVDLAAVDPGNSDNTLELDVSCPRRLAGSSGLDAGHNLRYSHVHDGVGGFTPYGK